MIYSMVPFPVILSDR